ncbi:MAG TPA: Gfo/Idh/MocA family oxidoreductase [bacterium]|nr:Gfo/Idh/MocA family oxidoreductase [bacterium]
MERILKIAFIGTNEGNGHIYSWSAIINGSYNFELIKKCGYPVIVDYLYKNRNNLGIKDARVTHVWTHDRNISEQVSKTTFIDNVIDSPEQAIGYVDGAVITTDIGSTHVNLAKPFIDANIPVFIDKPLADNIEDLKTFYNWYKEGKLIMSCSSLRYAREIKSLDLSAAGRIEYISGIMSKSWERYGVHAIEGLCAITGINIDSVFNTGDQHLNLALINHKNGLRSLLQVIYNSKIFGRYDIFCEKNTFTIETSDSFYMFREQIEDIVKFFVEHKYPFPFLETVEIIKAVIAGIESRKTGKPVHISEINLEE